MKICILTAGKGTRMGPYSKQINKALLPIDSKAVISHIIKKFSINDTFVVALGYKGNQVVNYLKTAHPNNKFEFVEVENYDGEGSGPGLSLLSSMNNLQEPFLFFACDGLFFDNMTNFESDWIGISKIKSDESHNYCNVLIKDQNVVEIRDKQKCDESYYAFTGAMFIKNYKTFWDYLKNGEMIDNEHQISSGLKGLIDRQNVKGNQNDWKDVGDITKYNNMISKNKFFDFSKPNEFIYFVNNRVIKFSLDSDKVEKLIKKCNMQKSIFPNIHSSGNNFLYYEFFEGKLFYEIEDVKLFEVLLKWLSDNLWKPISIDRKKMEITCRKFYLEKTKDRLEQFRKKYPDYKLPDIVNKSKIHSLDEILDKIPWDDIFNGVSYFIHGDLNFGNILYNKSKDQFRLIDARVDFGGNVEYGDIYYDLAKLYAGLIINFNHIKKNQFQYTRTSDSAEISFESWGMRDSYLEILEKYIVTQNFDLEKIKILAAITFLNMAPLHNYPFDHLLMGFGAKTLDDELFKKNNTA